MISSLYWHVEKNSHQSPFYHARAISLAMTACPILLFWVSHACVVWASYHSVCAVTRDCTGLWEGKMAVTACGLIQPTPSSGNDRSEHAKTLSSMPIFVVFLRWVREVITLGGTLSIMPIFTVCIRWVSVVRSIQRYVFCRWHILQRVIHGEYVGYAFTYLGNPFEKENGYFVTPFIVMTTCWW
jgi:hypothetical protein